MKLLLIMNNDQYKMYNAKCKMTTNDQIILIDKDPGWTSFDVVNKLRHLLHIKKIGHAGTLDPLATGLLIICTGKMTKEIEKFQNLEKEYTGTILLGKTTASYDLETPFETEYDISSIINELIYETTKKFLGEIVQIPPAYSAIKINGQRAYKKIRRGEQFEIKQRKVFIKDFIITSLQLPDIHFKIICSKGTYIRSIANDFGKMLNAGACLKSLRRTAIGKFRVEEAQKVSDFKII